MDDKTRDERYEQMKSSAEKILISPTSKFIKDLNSEQSFKIISPYPTIHKVDFFSRLDASGELLFRVPEMNRESKVAPATFQNIGYGLLKPFMVSRNNKVHLLQMGVDTLRISLSSEIFRGSIRQFESMDKSETPFFRATIPIIKEVAVLARYFLTEPFSTETSFRAGGLMKLRVNGFSFRIFDYELEKQNHLFIDALSSMTYDKFIQCVKSFSSVFGLVSGYFFRDRILIFRSQDINIEHIYDYSYLKIDKSKSGLEAVRPRDMIDFFPDKQRREDRYLGPNILEGLMERCLEDDRFFRAINIISESHGYPLEIRASTYSVALETLKNIIIEANEEKINPIKTKTLARELVSKLKKVVNDFDDNNFNNKKLILQKIEHLNQIGNTDSFSKAFELLNLKLSDKDLQAINKRNDFLHGRLPFQDEEELTKEKELQLVTLRLHFLLCSLILKMCKYDGYLVNNIRLNFQEMTDESVYRNISI